MSLSLDIKNLAIALEALSRIPNSGELSEQIQENLTYTVNTFEQERRAQREQRTQANVPDDDISF